VVEEFAIYFRRSPEQLGPEHVREYQVHLFRDRKFSPRTIERQAAALRFLFVKTLGRLYLPDASPFPKHHRGLSTVLSRQEVSRLIDSTIRSNCRLCRFKMSSVIASSATSTRSSPSITIAS